MGYSRALEQQLAYLEWLKGPRGRDWFELCHEEFRTRLSVPETVKGSDEENPWLAPGIQENIEYPLRHGETFYWADDIADACAKASVSAPDIVLYREMLPSDHGFMWFEKPIDASAPGRGREFPVHAISWSFAPGDDDDDDLIAVTPYIVLKEHESGVPLLGTDWFIRKPISQAKGWPFSLKYEADEDGIYRLLSGYEGAVLRLLGTMLIFMEQRIVVPDPMEVLRPTKRRLARSGFPLQSMVRIIRLRKKQSRSSSSIDSDPVEWSYRWIVGGHWHPYWYPSLGEHRLRWVLPYIKGPEDKPLKPPSTTVYAVVR